MQFHSFQVPQPAGSCHGDCRLPATPKKLPALAFLPDLCFTKAYGFYPWLRERLAARSLCLGIDGGLPFREEAEDLARRAAEYTLSREIAAWMATFRALFRGDLPGADSWDRENLAILGHGKGAALALHLDRRLRAEGRPAPQALVLLCPPRTLVRQGGEGGMDRVEVSLDDARTVVLHGPFLEDARRLARLASLVELVATTPARLLVLAAEEDRVFPVTEAEDLVKAAESSRVRLLLLEETGHFLGSGHPFEGPTPALSAALAAIERFLDERFGSGDTEADPET